MGEEEGSQATKKKGFIIASVTTPLNLPSSKNTRCPTLQQHAKGREDSGEGRQVVRSSAY